MQEGFDRGYANGATTGWEVGLLYGGAAGVAAVLAQSGARQMRVADRGGADSSAEQAVPSSSSRNKDNVTAASIRATQQNPVNSPGKGERDILGGVNDAAHCSVSSGRNVQADKIVEELREAALRGPDDPKISKEEVLGGLRRLGSAGAAVANRLAEQEPR